MKLQGPTPIFFNAHHAPIGAFATFTFGCKGAKGGLGLELPGPADENLYIGCEDPITPGTYRAFPFYAEATDRLSDFHGGPQPGHQGTLTVLADSEIERDFSPCIDEWRCSDLKLRVISPIVPVPDPLVATEVELRDALCPAVYVEVELDNRSGTFPRTVFFGYEGSDKRSAMRVLDDASLIGVGQGLTTALVTLDPMVPGLAWSPLELVGPSQTAGARFMLGTLGMLTGTVAAGQIQTFRIVVCFHRAGIVTSGLPTRYLYTRWFPTIEDAARHALSNFDQALRSAEATDAAILADMPRYRALPLSHALRSYYGSTQLLEREEGTPVWVVNEGEYRMMNTCDLVVDQVLYELRMNPWTVRNELDFYSERYLYLDTVRSPGDPAEKPGGVAFSHDMGVANVFSMAGHSGYEKAGLTGCFSFMSSEELTNWVLSACLYALRSGDKEWTSRNLDLLDACLASLCNRDDPDPSRRNGVMGLDASRCQGGAEITTYDSLDASLGQARDNVYLAVKWWSAFVLLESIFQANDMEAAALLARQQAGRTAATVVCSIRPDGTLPAVLSQLGDARTIPVIEGLIYPLEAGLRELLAADGSYGVLIETLGAHLRKVLAPGICKFTNGGWKLSSTSNNSWLSKIYLCQYISAELFGVEDHASDEVHWAWLMDDANVYYAWSDQMEAGKAVGSRYYPRGVTSILWTKYRAPEVEESTSERAVAGID